MQFRASNTNGTSRRSGRCICSTLLPSFSPVTQAPFFRLDETLDKCHRFFRRRHSIFFLTAHPILHAVPSLSFFPCGVLFRGYSGPRATRFGTMAAAAASTQGSSLGCGASTCARCSTAPSPQASQRAQCCGSQETPSHSSSKRHQSQATIDKMQKEECQVTLLSTFGDCWGQRLKGALSTAALVCTGTPFLTNLLVRRWALRAAQRLSWPQRLGWSVFCGIPSR